MTPDEKARLRALADAATPGPWEAGEPSVFGDSDDKPQSCIDTPAGVLTWDDHGGEVFLPSDAEFIAAVDPATVTALLDALDTAEAERDEAVANLDRLHSWTGLMGLLDEHWPESIFPTLPDSTERDAGPRIISLIRRLDAETLRADRAEARIKAVRDMHGPWEEPGHRVCRVCIAPAEWEETYRAPYPCPTVRALDGDA